MREDVIRRYGALPAPRYTSYPTAADFSAAIGSAEKARWLETLDPSAPVSIYLHIPYCRELCHYCGCATKVAIRDHVLDDYLDCLKAEIEITAKHFGRPPRVSHLHWGGGTPSIMGYERLRAALDALSRHVRFEPGYEHAIELDPRGVTKDLAHDLARLGVNRVSLGVQDLDPDVQCAIGRIQPLEVLENAFAALRASGLDAINVDLIHGLPKQTVASAAATARQVVALQPDRVACYGYAHLPAKLKHQRLIDEAALPDIVERFAQARAMAGAFEGAGYDTIGIDHFARSSDPLAVAHREARLKRNFQGYTDVDVENLIAFGASAISCMAQGFVQNAANPTDYSSAVREGRLPVKRGHKLTEDDRLRGAIIAELMCAFRIDLKRHAPPGAFSDELALLRPMAADGLTVVSDEVIEMTPEGRPFVRVAAAVFDAFLYRNPSSQFSTAV